MTPQPVYPVSTKKCSTCEVEKPFDCFYPEKTCKYGRHSSCKKCMNTKERAYRRLHPRKQFPVTSAQKTCRDCDKQLPADEFYTNNAAKDGLNSRCRQCCKSIRDKREIENPGWTVAVYRRAQDKLSSERKREISSRGHFQRYGTTQEWFDAKLASQGGKCEMCGIEKNQKKQRFFMDHDHSCCNKKACDKCRRGLLCVRCNFRLGAVEDAQWLAKAIAYLRTYGKDLLPHIDLNVPSVQPTSVPCVDRLP